MNPLIEKLRELRENGLTQKGIAKKLKISRSAYSNYEQGLREPDLNTLKKICLLLNVSSDYLLGIEN